MRIDKYLSNSGIGSRKDCAALIRAGRVAVNENIITDSAIHIDPDSDKIAVDGVPVQYNKFVYLMFNKPAGCVSANHDNLYPTVFELVPSRYAHYDLCCVGRLDLDTEGLLLLTNDGEFAHRLMSPKYHLPKTYYVRTLFPIEHGVAALFKEGIPIGDEYIAKPAELEIITEHTANLSIYEGKFHQVKRMFVSAGNKVDYLKRIRIGSVNLDDSLPFGGIRELTQEELKILKTAVGLNQ